MYTHSIFSKYLAPCLFQNISQLVSGHFLVLWIICRVEKTSQKCTQKRGFCSTLGSYNCNIFYGHLLDYWYPYLPCCISGQDLICYLQSVLHLAKASPVDVNMIASVCKFLTAYIDNCTLSSVDLFVSFGISFIDGWRSRAHICFLVAHNKWFDLSWMLHTDGLGLDSTISALL